MKTMDLILVIVAILLLVFTAIMLVTFWRYGMIPDTLCTCVYACLGGECGVMGMIQTAKVRAQERKWQLEDEERMKESSE